MLASNHLIGFGVAGSDPPTTSYSNTGGTGNRSASIPTVTMTITAGGGTAAALVDGTTTSNTGFWANPTQSSGQILFDFATAKYIDEIKYYQGATATAWGPVIYEGSNDNSNWTALCSGFSFPASSPVTTTLTSPDYYRYYRLRVTGSTGITSANWNNEFDFKISA